MNLIGKNGVDSFTISFKYNSWDDFGYKTTYTAIYNGPSEKNYILGEVKIGDVSRKESPHLYIEDFKEFEEGVISLGVSKDYYVRINKLGSDLSKKIYCALNDIAYDKELLYKYKREPIVVNSLMRFNSIFQVEKQFNRIAHGGVELTRYDFNYKLGSVKLEFHVEPFSFPPSNIHVIIGRNGVGKTYLIRNMVNGLVDQTKKSGIYSMSTEEDNQLFANVLLVSFSPFDEYELPCVNDTQLPVKYIGLNKEGDLQESLLRDFKDALKICIDDRTKHERWKKTMEFLRSDPFFFDLDTITNVNMDSSEELKDVEHKYKSLSSGHKVVLLAVAQCVAKLEEKSILFLDEPENHLHPPLLSAFIRALSYLLINRNSVAIISTHSPIVLQEVPKDCVWKVDKFGDVLDINRLGIECFGASIGVLTREVFGLEVTKSGFSKMILDDVDKGESYDEIMSKYNYNLGDEAQLLIQALISSKEE